MKSFFFFVLLFVTSALAAQNPKLIKTLTNTGTESSTQSDRYWRNNQWNGLFFYQGKGTTTKLCITNGTDAGTAVVKDLGDNGGLQYIITAKDFVYFTTSKIATVSPVSYEVKLWKSDGTDAGTSLIYAWPTFTSINNGPNICSDQGSAFNYCMDGTTNLLYFNGYDATNGNELWVSDGTTAGTKMLKNIMPGVNGSFPWGYMKIGNEVFFNATAVAFERKLWKTNGTEAGTVQVAVPEPFFIVNGNIEKLGNKMVFFATNTTDGYEPYVSDGTPAGTFMLGNFNTTATNSGNSLLPYVEEANLKANSKYCFLVMHNGTDTSLYRTDGTAAGTIRVAPSGMSIYTRQTSGGYVDVDENGIWVVKYNSIGSGNSETIYKSDGTLAGTSLVAQNISYGQKVKIYKNALWMQARNSGSVSNVEPWRSGGTQSTTNKALEIAPGEPIPGIYFSSDPHNFFVTNNKLYFFAKNASSSTGLYEYNGDFTFNGSVAGGNWKDSANWNSAMPPGIVDTVYVNAGTPNALTVNNLNARAYAGTLILGANATINIANGFDTLYVASEITAGSNVSTTGNGAVSTNSFNGNSVSIKSGLTINKLVLESNTNLQTGNLSLTGSLTLFKGSLTLNTANAVMKESTSTITALNNNYIITNNTGTLQIESIGSGGRTGTVLFPIGNTSYNPVSISNGGTTDAFGARVITGISTTYTGETPGTLLTSGAVNRTWMLTEANSGGSNAVITLQWNAADELPSFDRNATLLGHYTGGAWTVGGQSAAGGTNPYNYSRAGITSFSPFGILNSITTPVNNFWRNSVRLNVYPNPSTTFMYVTLTEQMQKETLQVQVLNATGQLVMEQQIAPARNSNFKLNTGGLSEGVYYLFIKGKTVSATARFTKHIKVL